MIELYLNDFSEDALKELDHKVDNTLFIGTRDYPIFVILRYCIKNGWDKRQYFIALGKSIYGINIGLTLRTATVQRSFSIDVYKEWLVQHNERWFLTNDLMCYI